MLKITVVVGNPKPQSRTGKIAQMLAHQLVGDIAVDLQVIDLCDHVDELFKWPSTVMTDLTTRVASSELVILASPTYKASYTGLLKTFLDRYPANGLANVTAICLMTGADFAHSMAPTVNLVPLLLELGATVPVKGLYFNTAQIDRVEEFVAAQREEIVGAFSRIAAMTEAIGLSGD